MISPECRISVIIPALNEGQVIRALLESLQSMRLDGHELILVDGGSSDDTCFQAVPLVDRLITSTPGRARQMNEGARVAAEDILWFVHADSQLPADAGRQVCQAMQSGKAHWGRFDVEIIGQHPLLKLVSWMMNWRSRWTGIATGDQAIFVRRDAFFSIGGFPEIPLMEDIAISTRLKRISSPCCLRTRLRTSGRRWERNGVVSTILLICQLP